jgi:hypothetical protein
VRDIEREKMIQLELERLKHEADDGEDEVIRDEDEADLIPQEEPRDRTPLVSEEGIKIEIDFVEIKETKKEESPQTLERRTTIFALEESDSMTSQCSKQYLPGSVVWAKCDPLPFWPALVNSK